MQVSTFLWQCDKQLYRSSRTPLCTFCTPLQILQLSFQQWISLTKNLQLIHLIANITLQPVLPSVLESAALTSTTSLQTAPKCIGSLWVSIQHSTLLVWVLMLGISLTSVTQACIFQECKLGGEADQYCQEAHQEHIRAFLHQRGN